MSNLPAGIYTAFGMATSGKTVMLAITGEQFGEYSHDAMLKSRPSLAAYLPVLFPLPGTTQLPAGVYTAFSMTTSGKSVMLAATGSQFGKYSRVYTIVLYLDDSTIPRFIAISDPIANFLGETSFGVVIIADPLATFRGLTSPGGFFEGVASPLATFFGYQKFGSFVGTADARESMEGVMALHFIGTAYPQAQFLTKAGQNENCVSTNNPPTVPSAPNYVY